MYSDQRPCRAHKNLVSIYAWSYELSKYDYLYGRITPICFTDVDVFWVVLRLSEILDIHVVVLYELTVYPHLKNVTKTGLGGEVGQSQRHSRVYYGCSITYYIVCIVNNTQYYPTMPIQCFR